MAKNDEQKRRAAEYVLLAMLDKGWSRERLRKATGLDPATLRTFLAGETWPQSPKRDLIERALDLKSGSLELAAEGLLTRGEQTEGDPVETAIHRSALSRANKAKLIGAYYEMLDQQQERRSS